MKRFYLRYCGSDAKVQRSVALLPWSHNVYLLGKNLDDSATLFYAQETIEKGWNRDTTQCYQTEYVRVAAGNKGRQQFQSHASYGASSICQ